MLNKMRNHNVSEYEHIDTKMDGSLSSRNCSLDRKNYEFYSNISV